MSRDELQRRITADPAIYAGAACVRGTRVPVVVILDALAEGLTVEEILDHYPSLDAEDVWAAAAHGADLARENLWKVRTE
jgi:uncharacterized protein (DUF433 family)